MRSLIKPVGVIRELQWAILRWWGSNLKLNPWAGVYHHQLLNRDYPRIQIVTVQEMLEGQRIDLPLSLDVLKSAVAVDTNEQQALALD